MTRLVADTSALVSLGIVANGSPDPLSSCLERYDVLVPPAVLDELREIAEYDDEHARAATVALDRTSALATERVDLDSEFPLDDGENAAVTLANERDAALFLCDEFNRLGLIHASLADSRLLTTPTLLSVFVRNDEFSATEALELLEEISSARTWNSNSYVQRSRAMLKDA